MPKVDKGGINEDIIESDNLCMLDLTDRHTYRRTTQILYPSALCRVHREDKLQEDSLCQIQSNSGQ